MLSFLFYHLIKNPAAYQKAQKEIDEVIGRGPITVDHMSKLPYLEGCMRETLRLFSTAPVNTLQIRPDSTEDVMFLGGGKYKVVKGQPVVAILHKLHRDPLGKFIRTNLLKLWEGARGDVLAYVPASKTNSGLLAL